MRQKSTGKKAKSIKRKLSEIWQNQPTEWGFSLAEVMVAAGIMAGLSLVLMQISKNQQQTISQAESRSEELEILNRIRSILLQKPACEATFGGQNLGGSVPSIRQSDGSDVFVVGQEYGNRALRLSGLEVTNETVPSGGGLGTANLNVSLERLKPGMINPPPRNIQLQVLATGPSGTITECFADTDGTILTSKEEMCIALDGIFNHDQGVCDLASYPSADADFRAVSTSYLSNFMSDFQDDLDAELDNKFLPLVGGTLTGQLDIEAPLIVEGNIEGGGSITAEDEICIGSDCRTTFATQSCEPGHVVTHLNSDGTLQCQALACPANQFFSGLDSSGTPVCRPFPTETCPTNQYVSEVRPDGTVVCQQVPYHWAVTCTTGSVIQSVAANGTPTCTQINWNNIANKPGLCPTGSVLRGFNANGSVNCVVDRNVFDTHCPPVAAGSKGGGSRPAYVTGFDSNGNPTCHAPETPQTSSVKGSTNGPTNYDFFQAEAQCPEGYTVTGCTGVINCVCWGTERCDFLGTERPSSSSCRARAYGRRDYSVCGTLTVSVRAMCIRI